MMDSIRSLFKSNKYIPMLNQIPVDNKSVGRLVNVYDTADKQTIQAVFKIIAIQCPKPYPPIMYGLQREDKESSIEIINEFTLYEQHIEIWD